MRIDKMMRILALFAEVLFVMLFTLTMTGCGIHSVLNNKEPRTIRDIAFDVNKKSGYTVYIAEDSSYIPYLVLTSDYNSNTLLLRKDVLDVPMPLNDYYAYYDGSQIDTFLNEEYLLKLSSEMRNAIIKTNIIITSEDSLYTAGIKVTNIDRDMFLLSYTELNYPDHPMAAIEGEALEYFSDNADRIAFLNGDVQNWWLRTPYTNYDSMSWAVGVDGSRGEESSSEPNGIRPAFCVDSQLSIIKSQSVKPGEHLYILSFE